jgi:glycerol-3-phosphate dehydrogenase
MRRDLDSLARQTFDVVVIGGGISGACLAHDAALRGLSVALIEQGDFGAATSAASSKVLHSGIRYLQQLEIAKLRESALERASFQRIAPHLTHYVPFLVPAFRGLARGRLALRAALVLHERLCAGQNSLIHDASKHVPRSRFYSKAETLSLAPVLASHPDLTGAGMLFESHMHSSERMTLAFVKSAARSGAQVANYVSAESLLTEGSTARGILARDVPTGNQFEIRARIVANAAGPWIPSVNQRFGAAGLTRRITTFAKGAHLVTRPLTRDVALVLPTTKRQRRLIDRGGRHLFVIPWRERSLIGTSNVPFGDTPGHAQATSSDVRELLDDVNRALPGVDLSIDDVTYAFAGLYPLTDQEVMPDVYQATGSYQIVDHGARGDVGGVISVLGMKFTTARRLAERATDLIVRRLGAPTTPGRTATTPLVGGDIDDLPGFVADATARHLGRVDGRVMEHLVHHYGTEVDALLATAAPGLDATSRLAADRECIEAEVAYAVTHEMALHLEDVVLRRTGLGTLGHPGRACLRRSADIMGERLGWSESRIDAEVATTEARFTPASG